MAITVVRVCILDTQKHILLYNLNVKDTTNGVNSYISLEYCGEKITILWFPTQYNQTTTERLNFKHLKRKYKIFHIQNTARRHILTFSQINTSKYLSNTIYTIFSDTTNHNHLLCLSFFFPIPKITMKWCSIDETRPNDMFNTQINVNDIKYMLLCNEPHQTIRKIEYKATKIENSHSKTPTCYNSQLYNAEYTHTHAANCLCVLRNETKLGCWIKETATTQSKISISLIKLS